MYTSAPGDVHTFVVYSSVQRYTHAQITGSVPVLTETKPNDTLLNITVHLQSEKSKKKHSLTIVN